jgi:hypothetical protein
MKKIALALLLLPTISFAENVNFFNAEIGIGGDNIDTVNSIGYEAVVGGKLSAGLKYVDLQFEDGSKYDSLEINVDYAFNTFDTGSLYTGVGTVMPYNEGGDILGGILQSPNSAHDKLSTAVKAGYSKRSGDSLDFDIGVVFVDNYTMYKASLRVPLNGDFGLTYAVTQIESGTALASLGLSFTL